MSVFMSSIPSLVLSDSPPESKVTPLPTSTTRRFAPRRLPGEVNEARLLGAPLRDRQVEAHAELGAGGAIEDLDREAVGLRRVPHSVARAAMRVGVMTPAGSLTRSRARATARAVERARASAAPPRLAAVRGARGRGDDERQRARRSRAGCARR